MIAREFEGRLLQRLTEIRRLCPEMRLGQILATIGTLGEDATGRSLWEIEDEELASAIDRFADDLHRRANN